MANAVRTLIVRRTTTVIRRASAFSAPISRVASIRDNAGGVAVQKTTAVVTRFATVMITAGLGIAPALISALARTLLPATATVTVMPTSAVMRFSHVTTCIAVPRPGAAISWRRMHGAQTLAMSGGPEPEFGGRVDHRSDYRQPRISRERPKTLIGVTSTNGD